MSSNTQQPYSPFLGKKASPRILTRSHGIIRPNLVMDFSLTPKLEIKVVDEFDNKVPGLIYQVTGEGTGKFSFTENNQPAIAAAMVDADPTVATFQYNPNLLQPFDVFTNYRGMDGKVKASSLAYGCQLSGNAFSQPVKEGAKRTVDFTCENIVFFYGMGLAYNRVRGTGVQQAVPTAPSTDASTLATTSTGGYLTAGVYYVMITATTANGETLPSIESSISVPTGTSTNLITVTCPNVSAPVTGYNVYVSNVSNGEVYTGAAAAATANTLVITTLPPFTAQTPPAQNTSGIWVSATDLVFSTDAATLSQVATAPAGSSLLYALTKLNGVVIGTVDNPAPQGTFYIDVNGQTFTTTGTSTYQCWDVIYPYLP